MHLRPQIHKDPSVGKGLRLFFNVPPTPKKYFILIAIMISPEAPEKGFHQREQEAMHFKSRAKVFEQIEGVGGHTQLH